MVCDNYKMFKNSKFGFYRMYNEVMVFMEEGICVFLWDFIIILVLKIKYIYVVLWIVILCKEIIGCLELFSIDKVIF